MTQLSYSVLVSDMYEYPYTPSIPGTNVVASVTVVDSLVSPPVAIALRQPQKYSAWIELSDRSDMAPWDFGGDYFVGFKDFINPYTKIDCADVVWRLHGINPAYMEWDAGFTRVFEIDTNPDLHYNVVYDDTVSWFSGVNIAGTPEWSGGFRPVTMLFPNQPTYLERALAGGYVTAGNEAAIETYCIPAATPGRSDITYSGFSKLTYTDQTPNMDSDIDRCFVGVVDITADPMDIQIGDIVAGVLWDGSAVNVVYNREVIYSGNPLPSEPYRRLTVGGWKNWNGNSPPSDFGDAMYDYIALGIPNGSAASPFISQDVGKYRIFCGNVKYVKYIKMAAGAPTQEIYLDMGVFALPAPTLETIPGDAGSYAKSFVETRFPTYIANGGEGGLGYSTTIDVSSSGFEVRDAEWEESRGQFNVGLTGKPANIIQEAITFFRCMKGKARAFRYKDWADYSATESEGILKACTFSDNVFQMYKRYELDGLEGVFYRSDRIIQKLVEGTVHIYHSGVELTDGFTINYNDGTVLVRDYNANLTWSGEFDVPVRFDTDEMRSTADTYNAFNWDQIPLKEVKVLPAEPHSMVPIKRTYTFQRNAPALGFGDPVGSRALAFTTNTPSILAASIFLPSVRTLTFTGQVPTVAIA